MSVFLICERFVHGLALQPLGGERGTGDRAAAAERLELGVFDDAVSALTFTCSFITSPHSGAPTMPVPTFGSLLVERADVPRVVVMIENFI